MTIETTSFSSCPQTKWTHEDWVSVNNATQNIVFWFFFCVFLKILLPKRDKTQQWIQLLKKQKKKNCGWFFVFLLYCREDVKKKSCPSSTPHPPPHVQPPIPVILQSLSHNQVHQWMITSSFGVHQWWSITTSKNLWALKIALNLNGHSCNAVHFLFFFFFSFFFVLLMKARPFLPAWCADVL